MRTSGVVRLFGARCLAKRSGVMLGGELELGKLVLRDYVNGTIGFRRLSAATKIPVKNLMRMLGRNGNLQAANLFEIVAQLQKREGIRLEPRVVARRGRRRRASSGVVKRRARG